MSILFQKDGFIYSECRSTFTLRCYVKKLFFPFPFNVKWSQELFTISEKPDLLFDGSEHTTVTYRGSLESRRTPCLVFLFSDGKRCVSNQNPVLLFKGIFFC